MLQSFSTEACEAGPGLDEEQAKRKEITKEVVNLKEILAAMNSFNQGIQSTAKLDNKRLTTFYFETWCEADSNRHIYFEKPMRSWVLTIKESATFQCSDE